MGGLLADGPEEMAPAPSKDGGCDQQTGTNEAESGGPIGGKVVQVDLVSVAALPIGHWGAGLRCAFELEQARVTAVVHRDFQEAGLAVGQGLQLVGVKGNGVLGLRHVWKLAAPDEQADGGDYQDHDGYNGRLLDCEVVAGGARGGHGKS